MNHIDNVKQCVRYITDSIFTCEVGVVERFDPVTSSADVRLLVKQMYPNGSVDETSLFLHQVPIRYPSIGGFVIYSPLEIGDSVYVHFSRSDWDNWLLNSSNNQIVVADGVGKHSHNCAYIEVGARNYANPARKSQYQSVTHIADDTNVVTFTEQGVTITSGGSTVQINPSGQITLTGNINITGNVTVTGNLTAANITTPVGNFNAHIHTDAEGRPTSPAA